MGRAKLPRHRLQPGRQALKHRPQQAARRTGRLAQLVEPGPGIGAHRRRDRDAPLFTHQVDQVVVQQDRQGIGQPRELRAGQQGLRQPGREGAQGIEQGFGLRVLLRHRSQRQVERARQAFLAQFGVKTGRDLLTQQLCRHDGLRPQVEQALVQARHIDLTAQLAGHQGNRPGQAAQIGQQQRQSRAGGLLSRQPAPGQGHKQA